MSELWVFDLIAIDVTRIFAARLELQNDQAHNVRVWIDVDPQHPLKLSEAEGQAFWHDFAGKVSRTGNGPLLRLSHRYILDMSKVVCIRFVSESTRRGLFSAQVTFAVGAPQRTVEFQVDDGRAAQELWDWQKSQQLRR